MEANKKLNEKAVSKPKNEIAKNNVIKSKTVKVVSESKNVTVKN